MESGFLCSRYIQKINDPIINNCISVTNGALYTFNYNIGHMMFTVLTSADQNPAGDTHLCLCYTFRGMIPPLDSTLLVLPAQTVHIHK